MSLSCDCGYGDYDTFYEIEYVLRVALTDYRCYGCGKQGVEGDHVYRYTEYHYPDEDEQEELDVPEDEGVADLYRRVCEECGDLHEALTSLGFCVSADFGFIEEAMREYRENYVRRPT